MQLDNRTSLPTLRLAELMARAVDGRSAHDRLVVRVSYTRHDCRQSWTGVYRHGGPIRVSINKRNRYPLVERLASGIYVDRRREVIGPNLVRDTWQQLAHRVQVPSGEYLALLGFLHEYSHFLDFGAGRRMRFRQTQADRFAYEALRARFPEVRVEAARA